MPVKRSHWLLKLHRYLGLIGCVLFLVWFLSGMVMMYVRYPELTMAERRTHLPLLQLNQVKVPSPVPGAVLGMLLDRPVYRSDTQVYYADNNQKLDSINEVQALQIAGDFFKKKYAVHHYSRITCQDQWLNKSVYVQYLPAYKIQMNDPAVTTLYVSIVTGEVFQEVNRQEMILSWLGPIPHWLYFKILIIKPNKPIWNKLVIYISFSGIILCISGLAAGIIRWNNKKGSPYAKRWLKWHHYAGLIFGLFTFTWVLSGFFSMDPLKMRSSEMLLDTASPISPIVALPYLKALPVKEIKGIQVNQTSYLLAYNSEPVPLVILPGSGIVKNVAALALDSAIQRTMPAYKMQRAVLTAYDAYYYARDNSKRLPVIRYSFNDDKSSVVYADPVTGAVLLRQDNNSKRLRWLYHGLHSFDYPLFYSSRPLWDIVLLSLLLGGTVLCVTGIALTIKWMRRKLRNVDLIHRG